MLKTGNGENGNSASDIVRENQSARRRCFQRPFRRCLQRPRRKPTPFTSSSAFIRCANGMCLPRKQHSFISSVHCNHGVEPVHSATVRTHNTSWMCCKVTKIIWNNQILIHLFSAQIVKLIKPILQLLGKSESQIIRNETLVNSEIRKATFLSSS